MRLLLTEDEEDLAQMVARGLRRSGYAVDVACDGEEALYCYGVNSYDLIILDLNLPKIDGLDVLKEIRKNDSSIKIIILSARSRIDERVLGLDSGANDYLVKPFDFMELEARIRTLLRMNFTQSDAVLTCGSLTVDTTGKNARIGEAELSLTKKEYAVLEYLICNKGSVISAEQIVEHVWDGEADPFSNSLKYHIHCIKNKLEQAGAGRNLISNIRGLGYVLKEESEGESE